MSTSEAVRRVREYAPEVADAMERGDWREALGLYRLRVAVEQMDALA